MKRIFKKILFEVQYQTENRKDILTTGKVYKPKIKRKMEDFLKKTKQKHLQFYIVFHITLVKETKDGIIDQVKAHLHSSTRRLIHMDMYNEVYIHYIYPIFYSHFLLPPYISHYTYPYVLIFL